MNLKKGWQGCKEKLGRKKCKQRYESGISAHVKNKKNSNLSLYIYFSQIFINVDLVHYSLHTPSTILFYAFKYFTNINCIV